MAKSLMRVSMSEGKIAETPPSSIAISFAFLFLKELHILWNVNPYSIMRNLGAAAFFSSYLNSHIR